MKHLRALLINPYIYDFAAYNFWSVPLGLLYVGAILRENGMDVELLDCLRADESKRKKDGRAPFLKEVVEKPAALAGISKNLRRYGISRDALKEELRSREEPDLVLVTSVMTYWYQGAAEVVRTVRETLPAARIVVGGIYPTLCPEHAATALSGADLVVGNRDYERFYRFIEGEMSFPMTFKPFIYDLMSLPYPCLDLYGNIPFVPLVTSFGCMFRCTYCATRYLHPKIIRRAPAGVIEEIHHWHGHGVRRFVLYDDNFLYRRNLYAKPLLKMIARLPFPVEFYNPNALNASLIDDETAVLLRRSGFQEVRLGLETIDPDAQRSTGGKIDAARFERALASLLRAGFSAETLHVYVLAGLPGQRHEDVRAAIDYLAPLGVVIDLAEYTPIPHSAMFETQARLARYPLARDPLYQNNAIFPFAWDGFTDEDMRALKARAKDVNHQTKKPFDNRAPGSAC